MKLISGDLNPLILKALASKVNTIFILTNFEYEKDNIRLAEWIKDKLTDNYSTSKIINIFQEDIDVDDEAVVYTIIENEKIDNYSIVNKKISILEDVVYKRNLANKLSIFLHQPQIIDSSSPLWRNDLLGITRTEMVLSIISDCEIRSNRLGHYYMNITGDISR